MNEFEIVKYPMVGEKPTILREQNKITLVVDKNATKKEVKEAVEKIFNVKILKINILNDMKGRKKAYIKLDPKNNVEEIISRLGIA